jgi:hypothetical protein
MFKRNHIMAGLVPGLLLPLAIYALLYAAFGLLESKGAASGDGLATNFRVRTLAIVALAINIWLIQTFKKRRWEDAMRGVVVATGILALIWLICFGPGLF